MTAPGCQYSDQFVAQLGQILAQALPVMACSLVSVEGQQAGCNCLFLLNLLKSCTILHFFHC